MVSLLTPYRLAMTVRCTTKGAVFMVIAVLVKRSQQQLLEQIKTIESFLSDGRTDEDALATCSRGWRPRSWDPDAGPCVRENCTEDHSPHPRHTGRWQSEIDRAVDRWPRHVVLGVPKAINAMPPTERLIVRGRAVMGLSFRQVGEMVGYYHQRTKAHYDAALEHVARQVWDEDGQPIW